MATNAQVKVIALLAMKACADNDHRTALAVTPATVKEGKKNRILRLHEFHEIIRLPEFGNVYLHHWEREKEGLL